MRILLVVSLGFGLMALSGCAGGQGNKIAMTVVEQIDVQQYLGKWHQIAALPAWFQEDCVGNVTADYSAGDESQINVVNSCDESDGRRKVADGQARFQTSNSVGKLDVTFVNLLGGWIWAFGGNYWIIGLDDGYQWAVIGEPSRQFGWILSRTKTLDDETLRLIKTIVLRENYDPCDFIFSTPQRQGRLCNI